MDDQLVKEYFSIMNASRETGISDTKISAAAQGFTTRTKGVVKNVLSAGGYKWEYI